MSIILPTTLSLAAAAAIINFWLAMRCGNIRRSASVSIGTGGNEMLERRMRAQLNFAENTPWVLFLIAGIELAGKGGQWLAIVGAVYMLGRVAHGLGMDGTGPFAKGRMVGTLTTMLSQLGLAIVAVLIVLQVM
ncbi:MAPEG family protein [Novosphingobium aquiterrae]|uniref:MAPEG family protein n=1 Tax=Novosphingobium aquiterrae TaxID=624388 RepID=A0ABV6PLI7_9SPHN